MNILLLLFLAVSCSFRTLGNKVQSFGSQKQIENADIRNSYGLGKVTSFPRTASHMKNNINDVRNPSMERRKLDEIIYLNNLMFSAAYYDHIEGLSLVPQSNWFDTWDNVTNALSNMEEYYYPLAINHIEVPMNTNDTSDHSNSFSYLETICSANIIVRSMWNQILYKRPFAINCDGHLWKGGFCELSGYKVCHECDNMCDSSEKILNIIGFNANIRPRTYPSWTITAVPAATIVTVHYSLSKIGKIECAALSKRQHLLSYTDIQSSTRNAAQKVLDPLNLQGSLTIPHVNPNTTYIIYCYTESITASFQEIYRAPLTEVITASQVIQTVSGSPPSLIVTVPSRLLMKNVVSAAFTISFSYLLEGYTMLVIPKLLYVGYDQCEIYNTVAYQQNNNNNQKTIPTSPMGNMAPMEMYFTTNKTQQLLYLQSYAIGCFELVFDVYQGNNQQVKSLTEGVNVHSKFHNIYQNDSHIFLQSINTVYIPDLQILTIEFDSSGLVLLLVFSVPTNEGGNIRYRTNFPCHEMLNFTTVMDSLCRFANSSSIKIMSPARRMKNSLNPGDMITVLPNKLKAACPVTNSRLCAHLPYVSISKEISFKPTVNVRASISFPRTIVLGQNLTLDISSSTGDAGRGWQTIQWDVYYNQSKNLISTIVQDYVNNGSLQWYSCPIGDIGCDTIPHMIMQYPGVYQFELTLTNILGTSSSTQILVEVIDTSSISFIPNIRITGPNRLSIAPETSSVVRSLITLENHICTSPLAVYWSIYRSDSLDTNFLQKVKSNKDPRSLPIVSYSVTPMHDYRFRATVFCGQHYAQQEISRYVLPVDITPTFSNGNQKSTSLLQKIDFDIRSSYANIPKVWTSDWIFQWDCVQKVPLNSTGCDNFYSFISLLHPTPKMVLSIFDPNTIFDYNAGYDITVTVFDPDTGRSASATQSLHTLGQFNQVSIPHISVKVPTFSTINSSNGNMISAYVTNNESFIAGWEILTTNITLQTRVFLNGGRQYFPIVVPDSLLYNRLAFQFRVYAFSLSSHCYSLSCMNPAEVSSSTFSISLNHPPSNGYLITSPTSGTDETIFSIFALNWQADNLPMYYSFFQSHANGVYHLLRNRMQINFMRGTLSVPNSLYGNDTFSLPTPEDAQNLVEVISSIADAYGATATTSLIIPVWPTMLNTSNVISSSILTSLTVSNQLNPEIVLPKLSTILDSLQRLSCMQYSMLSQEAQMECLDLYEVSIDILLTSLNKYNDGFIVATGLCRYVEALIEYGQIMPTSTDTLQAIVYIYEYLFDMTKNVGFAKYNSTILYQSLLNNADLILSLYELHVLEHADDDSSMTTMTYDITKNSINLPSTFRHRNLSMHTIPSRMQRMINDASSTYFMSLPFGIAKQFVTSGYMNITMFSDYFFPMYQEENQQTGNEAVEEVEEEDKEVWIVDDIRVSKNIFPLNITSIYGYLNVANTIRNSQNHSSTTTHTATTTSTNKTILFHHMNNENRYITLNLSAISIPETTDITYMIIPLQSTNISYMQLNTHTYYNTTSTSPSTSNTTSTATMTPHIIYYNCTDTTTTTTAATTVSLPTITCESEYTRGPPYTFPATAWSCPTTTTSSSTASTTTTTTASSTTTSHRMAFVCPLYTTEIICYNASQPILHRTGTVISSVLDTPTTTTTSTTTSSGSRMVSSITVTCAYPLTTTPSSHPTTPSTTTTTTTASSILSSTISSTVSSTAIPVDLDITTSTDSYHAYSFTGTFSFAIQTSEYTPATALLQPITSVGDTGNNTTATVKTVSILAIVCLGIAFLVFAGVFYYRIDLFLKTSTPGYLPVIPSTTAICVAPVPEVTSYVIPPNMTATTLLSTEEMMEMIVGTRTIFLNDDNEREYDEYEYVEEDDLGQDSEDEEEDEEGEEGEQSSQGSQSEEGWLLPPHDVIEGGMTVMDVELGHNTLYHNHQQQQQQQQQQDKRRRRQRQGRLGQGLGLGGQGIRRGSRQFPMMRMPLSTTTTTTSTTTSTQRMSGLGSSSGPSSGEYVSIPLPRTTTTTTTTSTTSTTDGRWLRMNLNRGSSLITTSLPTSSSSSSNTNSSGSSSASTPMINLDDMIMATEVELIEYHKVPIVNVTSLN